jgi:hypothetical protein
MMRSNFALAAALVCGSALLALASPALAVDQVSREQDIQEVRLGQRILVDDGSCPAGQIKEVFGSTLTPAGVARVKKCVSRAGTKTR